MYANTQRLRDIWYLAWKNAQLCRLCLRFGALAIWFLTVSGEAAVVFKHDDDDLADDESLLAKADLVGNSLMFHVACEALDIPESRRPVITAELHGQDLADAFSIARAILAGARVAIMADTGGNNPRLLAIELDYRLPHPIPQGVDVEDLSETRYIRFDETAASRQLKEFGEEWRLASNPDFKAGERPNVVGLTEISLIIPANSDKRLRTIFRSTPALLGVSITMKLNDSRGGGPADKATHVHVVRATLQFDGQIWKFVSGREEIRNAIERRDSVGEPPAHAGGNSPAITGPPACRKGERARRTRCHRSTALKERTKNNFRFSATPCPTGHCGRLDGPKLFFCRS